MHKVLIPVLFFFASCSSIHYIKKEDIKEYYVVGNPTVLDNVQIKTTDYNMVEYLNRINRDPSMSCFQDGGKNIINYIDFTTDEMKSYIRFMFFRSHIVYSYQAGQDNTGIDFKRTLKMTTTLDYKVVQLDCILIDKDGNAWPISTDKIVYVK